MVISQQGNVISGKDLKEYRMNIKYYIYLIVLSALCYSFSAVSADAGPQKDVTGTGTAPADWQSLIRQTPYWQSKYLFRNLSTIRRWVLLGKGYCHRPDRHLLFNLHGRFLGYIDDTLTAVGTQAKINAERHRLFEQGKVDSWIAGDHDTDGYPFALGCDQPFVNLDQAIDRMTGASADDRLWGTWDGMSAGSKSHQVSLVRVIHDVYRFRAKQGRYTFPETVMRDLLGQILIESGARKQAFSARSAKGLMQLRPSVLNDCNIPEAFRLHRMAQVDCALKLTEQNHRNLKAPFDRVFGGLAKVKRTRLYALLLVQTYQIGVGRMQELLTGPELGGAARYFAEHSKQYSAPDIALGMIYHNLGRKDLGFSTLYYLTDVEIAANSLCASAAMRDDPWCQSP